MIVEMVGSTCYSAILYQEPCDLKELKPHLFDTVRSIVRQFVSDAAVPAESEGASPAKPAPDEPETTI